MYESVDLRSSIPTSVLSRRCRDVLAVLAVLSVPCAAQDSSSCLEEEPQPGFVHVCASLPAVYPDDPNDPRSFCLPNGEKYRFIGVGAHHLAYIEERTSVAGYGEHVLAQAAAMNASGKPTVLRIFAPYIGRSTEQAREALKKLLDSVDEDKYLFIIALTDFYNGNNLYLDGDKDAYTKPVGSSNALEPDWFKSPAAPGKVNYESHYKEFVKELITSTGVDENGNDKGEEPLKNHKAIFAWELGNEMQAGNADDMLDFVYDMAGLIKGLDPNHMLTTGFISSMHATGGQLGLASDFYVERDGQASCLDFVSVHGYNNEWVGGSDLVCDGGLEDEACRGFQSAKHYAIEDFGLAMPYLWGELGFNRGLNIEGRASCASYPEGRWIAAGGTVKYEPDTDPGGEQEPRAELEEGGWTGVVPDVACELFDNYDLDGLLQWGFMPDFQSGTDFDIGDTCAGMDKKTHYDYQGLFEFYRSKSLELQAEAQANVDVALVIDSSGSMRSNDPNRQRLNAAKVYLDASLPDDHVGLVDFDSRATILSQLLALTVANKATLAGLIDRIDASGTTDIGAGVAAACQILSASTSGNDRKAAILLTDGEGSFQAGQNQCFLDNVEWNLHAFGFGAANLGQLESIVAGTGGSAREIPSADAIICEFQRMRTILAGGRPPAPCVDITIDPGETIEFMTSVPPGQSQATFSTSWPGSDVVMSLTSPSGRLIDRATVAPDVSHRVGPTFEVYTLTRPEAGEWTVSLFGADVAPGEPVTFGFTTLPISANGPPDVSQAVPSASELWPPNHKMSSVHIFDVTDPDGDPFTISITAITQDEPVSGPGNASSPDGEGLGTDLAFLRAERDGDGNGRVYQITFTARDDKGGESIGSVRVCVPHDRRGTPCSDDGQVHDSTVP